MICQNVNIYTFNDNWHLRGMGAYSKFNFCKGGKADIRKGLNGAHLDSSTADHVGDKALKFEFVEQVNEF